MIRVNGKRTHPTTASFEGGEQDPQAKECRWPLETGMIKETDSPVEHLNILIIAQ